MRFSYIVCTIALLAASQASAWSLVARQDYGPPPTPASSAPATAGSTSGTSSGGLTPPIPAACTADCTNLVPIQNCGNATDPTTLACVCPLVQTTDLTICFTCLSNATSPGLSAADLQSAVQLENQTVVNACSGSSASGSGSTSAPATTGAATSGAIHAEIVGSALLAIVGVATAFL